MVKEGDIIFLTKRSIKPKYRIFVSYMIALLTKQPGEKIKDVKVHSSIIYSNGGVLSVRDMDKNGDMHYTIGKYKQLYGDRLEVKAHCYKPSLDTLKKFNSSCRDFKVKYDYKNTFLYQVIRRLFGVFINDPTRYKRMCAEDAQRQFNLIEGIFYNPEKTNPNELYHVISHWKTVEL